MERELYADLIGREYMEDGRGNPGFDCVGLLLAICERRGLRVPAYPSLAGALALALQDWRKVGAPNPGDAILIRYVGPPWHVGVVIAGNLMLHAQSKQGVVVERFDTPKWCRRVEGFYRWVE